MTRLEPSPQEVLRGEILAQARFESDEILRQARLEAESHLARAEAEASQARQERLDGARVEAARRKESALATVPVETGRRRSARVEALLQSIHDEALRRLSAEAGEGGDLREALIGLAAEAISRMAADEFVVKLSAPDRLAWGEGLSEAIASRVGRSPLHLVIAEEPAVTEGGVMVQDGEGRQVWDNSLPARLERLWPELRRQLAVRTGLVAESESAGGGS